MKILHTSDWHIGKRLNGRERLDEQRAVLDEIAEICKTQEVELVLVAGDIFDTFLPSAEAETLFFEKIKKIAGEDRAVLIISGNHDDGVRLAAGVPLLEEFGVYVVGNERREISLSSNRKVRPVSSGEGFVVFENEKGERVFVNALPYPNEARFKQEKSELPYLERMKEWIEWGEKGNTEKYPSVFLSHIFVVGGEASDGEREIELGGARAVPYASLPPSDYIALGHLHKPQKMGKGNSFYSGSPLQYSFDEANTKKRVKVFDLTREGVQNLTDVYLSSGRKLCRLRAADIATAEELLDKNAEYLAEMTLVLSSPLTSEESARLANHENLVSLLTEINVTEGEREVQSRKNLSDSELFEAFYCSKFGEKPSDTLKEMFLSVLQKTEEE